MYTKATFSGCSAIIFRSVLVSGPITSGQFSWTGATFRFAGQFTSATTAAGFGVLPLAISSGAGAGAMNAIGTAVTGGMLSATFIDLFYIPLLFVVVSRRFTRRQPEATLLHSPDAPAASEVH